MESVVVWTPRSGLGSGQTLVGADMLSCGKSGLCTHQSSLGGEWRGKLFYQQTRLDCILDECSGARRFVVRHIATKFFSISVSGDVGRNV